uniref:Eukaryotic translation initiation factor 3 30 kDa subunit n=1 Tax=Grammatophora oceanica TaxID=210454 RepID=A0A6U5PFI3_9STRA|mmetsp:Transcript_5290/g.7384  ORF Transcript_5290/g.7384 Transcript_5290/m.7384 type:complete len:262 (+) Transcript_5290:133-918(+)|eukprot:CAMPEP_0194033502 /NCGR_PEP_ID=MMETSP0009_2-20130614/6175_1 /TAXON_ID=210454 /ORGANISM="Grammatophora oceanica, Strain CCMP 410" /LENGTH=261 /DNA_ID=CAMNT_0038674211 /DNA_START=109 /DNA_END=894 /DNA_ORIENTATION=+
MADNWDDSDDDWDKDDSEDDELNARLNKINVGKEEVPRFDDEEDLAVKERALTEQATKAELKKKGNALAEKKAAEQARKEELEIARKAMELEAEMEANMTPDELKKLKRKQIEDADNALTDDLFGTVDNRSKATGTSQGAGDTVVMKDLKDHLKHAKKVGQCIRTHKNVHLATAFLKEAIQECKDVLDDAAISELIKTCNVIKNEKVQNSKRKVKGQAQKSAKRDKAAEAKARKLQEELYGNNDDYDDYDEMGGAYEDAFF